MEAYRLNVDANKTKHDLNKPKSLIKEINLNTKISGGED